MHLDFVLVSNHALAWTHQVPVRLSRLDLEHDWNVALVDQLDRGRGSITLSRPEADIGNRVQRDKLTPVLLCLGRRSKRCFVRLHGPTILSINKLFND